MGIGAQLRELWDFDDPAGSERRFREAAEEAGGPVARERALTQVARALGLQDRFDEGHAVLDGLTCDDADVGVRRELERGRLLRSSGDDDAALRCFEAAADRARGAGLQELHVDALHMRALVLPREKRLVATEEALAFARAADDPQARDWDASLLNNLGLIHADDGNFERALEIFEEARAARERIGDPATTRVARWMVAWALRNLGRTDEALRMQRELKAEVEAAGQSDGFVDEELRLLEGEPPA